MTFRLQTIKKRFLLCLLALSYFLTSSPALLAAEEEASDDPVWVLSYAGLIFFVGATIILAILFSRSRPDTVLPLDEQKRVEKLRVDRFKKRQKEARLAAMQAHKKR